MDEAIALISLAPLTPLVSSLDDVCLCQTALAPESSETDDDGDMLID